MLNPPSKLIDKENSTDNEMKIKTPDTHPDELKKGKNGKYTHKDTGWTFEKNNTGYRAHRSGESHWDVSPKRGGGHLNVSEDGRIL